MSVCVCTRTDISITIHQKLMIIYEYLSKYTTDDKNHNPAHFLTLHAEGYKSVVTSSLASAMKALI